MTRLKYVIVAIILMLLCPLVAQATETNRLAGATRYETAIQISRAGWDTANTAIIAPAGNENLADALLMSPLAHALQAPILLTEGSSLNGATAGELTRLGVRTVYIPSNESVISKNVVVGLTNMGIEVVRLGGAGGTETSLNIARELQKRGQVTTVVLTSSTIDALTISSFAAAHEWPILWIEQELSQEMKNYLTAGGINTTYVIGGLGAVSATVESEAPGALRLGGTDRYDTNLRVLNHFARTETINNEKGLFVANGSNEHIVDALVAAVYMNGAPLYLTNGKALTAYQSLASSEFTTAYPVVTGLGGESVVPYSVLDTIVDSDDTQLRLNVEGFTIAIKDNTVRVENLPKEEDFDHIYLTISNQNSSENVFEEIISRDSDDSISANISGLPRGTYYIELYNVYYGSSSNNSDDDFYEDDDDYYEEDDYYENDEYYEDDYYYNRSYSYSYSSFLWGDTASFSWDGVSGHFTRSIQYERSLGILDKPYELASYLQPSNGMQSDAPEIKALAQSIASGTGSNYEKVVAVHDWVAANIYYDYDAYLGKTEKASTDALTTLANKRSVCDGYSTLTAALLRSLGIPTRHVSGLAVNSIVSNQTRTAWNDSTDTITSNHAWNEAYIDGRWVIIDTTWDSGNKWEDGRASDSSGLRGSRYLDPSLFFFARDHVAVRYN
jgi:putative cell wall-binding protein/transglutaminase-like putative cysteine protease